MYGQMKDGPIGTYTTNLNLAHILKLRGGCIISRHFILWTLYSYVERVCWGRGKVNRGPYADLLWFAKPGDYEQLHLLPSGRVCVCTQSIGEGAGPMKACF